MHLLAMADTVASCKIDLADRFAIDAARYEFSQIFSPVSNFSGWMGDTLSNFLKEKDIV